MTIEATQRIQFGRVCFFIAYVLKSALIEIQAKALNNKRIYSR